MPAGEEIEGGISGGNGEVRGGLLGEGMPGGSAHYPQGQLYQQR